MFCQETILAFYVTQTACYGAISHNGQTYKQSYALGKETQGQILVPFLQTLWQKVGCPVLDVIVVPNGPGSFTTVRLMLATALGLKTAMKYQTAAQNPLASRRSGPRLRTPSFFDVLLYNSPQKYAVVDSKRGDFFVGCHPAQEEGGEESPKKSTEKTHPEAKVLSPSEFQVFYQQNDPTMFIWDPDFHTRSQDFVIDVYDPNDLLDNLIALSTGHPEDTLNPYYVYQPVYKKMASPQKQDTLYFNFDA